MLAEQLATWHSDCNVGRPQAACSYGEFKAKTVCEQLHLSRSAEYKTEVQMHVSMEKNNSQMGMLKLDRQWGYVQLHCSLYEYYAELKCEKSTNTEGSN